MIERQELIRDRVLNGQNDILLKNRGKKIGVCIEANKETVETVPYLTH